MFAAREWSQVDRVTTSSPGVDNSCLVASANRKENGEVIVLGSGVAMSGTFLRLIIARIGCARGDRHRKLDGSAGRA
jgi:hypothetical protein